MICRSFEASYLRLLKCFESLKQMSSDEHTPVVDALVQQAFISIQTLHSVRCMTAFGCFCLSVDLCKGNLICVFDWQVYSSGNLKNMDQAEKFLVRFVCHLSEYQIALIEKIYVWC